MAGEAEAAARRAEVDKYIADLQFQIQSMRLQLDRDIYDNISVPTSVGTNTGMLPGSYGPYGGSATADFLTGNVDRMGQVGSTLDPRLAALGYSAGQYTLEGRQANDAATAQMARERSDELNRLLQERLGQGAERNQELTRIQSNREFDAKMEMETGQPYLNGAPMPAYLAPHRDWVQQWADNHNGGIPTYQDLSTALAKFGQTPEMYTSGISPNSPNYRPPGQPPGATGAMETDRTGQEQMNSAVRSIGAPVTAPGGVGSATTAAFGAGPARSQAQRELEERGRVADMQNGLDQRRVEIDQMRADAEVARVRGDTTIAASKEARADELERAAQELQAEIQRGQLALQNTATMGYDASGNLTLDAAKAVGSVAGQQTVEVGRELGRIGDQATLEREKLYGGAAYTETGETLEQRTQREQAEIQRMQIAAGLRGPSDAIQYARVVGGTPGGLRDVVGAAMGRYQNARTGDFGAAPQAATMEGLRSDVNGGYNSAAEAKVAGQMLGDPNQFAWQNVDRLAPTNQKLLYAVSEGQGREMDDIKAARERALGRYSRRPTAARMVA